MTGAVPDTITAFLQFCKKEYLLKCGRKGGTADGFRRFVLDRSRSVGKFEDEDFKLQAINEAATKAWTKKARDKGPDLFDVGEWTVPEFLTRRVDLFEMPEDDEAEAFEKVDHLFATVADGTDDATIKMRNAARASARAEKAMQAMDIAKKRAKGDVRKLLKEVANKKK
jgi:hypothetical protein